MRDMGHGQPRVPTWHGGRSASALVVGLCAVAVTAAMAVMALALAAPSRADVIPGAITSITTTATHVDQWDQVDFACTWAIPDGSQPGDTFTLTLPAELRWFGSRTFTLRAPDGSPVAIATADDSGHVVFTLTEYVLGYPVDVHGTCRFSTQYTTVGTGEEVDLVFQTDAGVVRVPVDTDEPCPEGCAEPHDEADKDMWWTDGSQQSTRSVVWAPATTADTSTVTLEDVPGPGLSLDCTSLVAHIGRHLDADGRITGPYDDETYEASVSCTPSHLTVTWSDVRPGEYTQIRVDSAVTDASLAEYTNRATVTVSGVDTPVDSTVRRTDGGGTGVGTPTTPPSPTTTTTTATPPATTTTTVPTAPPTTSSAPPRPSSTALSMGTTGGSATSTGGASALAYTGARILALTVAGATLLASGLVLSVSTRRRRPQGSG